MEISFDMRSYDVPEAFRRAAGRYKSDNPRKAKKKFNIRLVDVSCVHNHGPNEPYFTWKFEATE